MKVAVIGASSGIGLEVVQQALAKGYTVSTLSRSAVPVRDEPKLQRHTGDATVADDLVRAISGADAVLVTIGATGKKNPTLFADTARALIAAGNRIGLKAPIIAVTGFGTGASGRYLNLFMWLVINLILKKEYADKSRFEALLAGSSLCWEIVQPGMLSNGPLSGRYRLLPELSKGMKIKKASRADIADMMLKEAAHPRYLGRKVAVSY